MINIFFIRQNLTFFSIALFIIIFSAIFFIKPLFLFKPDGSLRDFGVGYKNKTIMPFWLLSIILAIFSYLCFFYFVNFYRF